MALVSILKASLVEVGERATNIKSEGQFDCRAGELCDSLLLINALSQLSSLLADHSQNGYTEIKEN
jgi:hypothetical protein